MSITACNHLQDAIYEAIVTCSENYTISHAEIIGVLNIIAYGFGLDHMEQEDEEDEEA